MYEVGSRGRFLIALLVGILTLPIAGITLYFTYSVEQRIMFAQGERDGLAEVALLGSFLADASAYASDVACRAPSATVGVVRARASASLDRADRAMQGPMIPDGWSDVESAWRGVRSGRASRTDFNRLFDPLTASYGRLSDASGLTFDPSLEGIDISDSLTYRLPRAVAEFQIVRRDLCVGGPVPTLAERLSFESGIARGAQLTDDALQDIDDAIGHGDPASLGRVQTAYRDSRGKLAAALAAVHKFVTTATPAQRRNAQRSLDELTVALLGLMREEGPAAGIVIDKRLSELRKERFITLIPGVLGALGALLVVWLVLRLLWERAAVQTAERAAAEHQRIAMHDSLTGLLNRRAFFTALENAATSGERHGVLCIVDIDHFKGVNDTYGHVVGDNVLIRIAGIIEASIRSTDVAARIGGDEFAIFLRAPIDVLGVERVLSTMTSDAAAQVEIDGKKFSTSVSVGAAFVQDVTKESVADAIGQADAALYRAKANARGRYVIFEAVGRN